MPKEKSVGAAVFRETEKGREFLLLHYPAGHWGLVKGKMEQGETEKETLLREIREETGLEHVEVIEGFKQETKYFFRRGKETVFKQVSFYFVRVKEGSVKISHEHQGFEWMPFGEAVERLSFKNTKNVLTQALEFLHKE